MSRGRKYDSYKAYSRHLKNGIGIGEKEDYSPWIRVQDIQGAQATGDKINGLKINRVHHTQSSSETTFFYLAEFNDSVIDIREQFPLVPLNLSISIANYLNIKPVKVPYVKGGLYHLLTTDFLLTTESGYVAVSVKPLKEFTTPPKDIERTLEKIEIERVWWESLGVDFKIFAPSQEDKIRAGNINWATDPLRYNYEITPFDNDLLTSVIPTGQQDYSALVDKIASSLNVDSIMAVNIFRVLIAQKFIQIDLSKDFLVTGIVDIYKVEGQNNVSYSNIA